MHLHAAAVHGKHPDASPNNWRPSDSLSNLLILTCTATSDFRAGMAFCVATAASFILVV